MRFFEILAQVIGLLVLEQRVSYLALKRQLDLDDAAIEDVKAELIENRRLARDHEGRMLVWTGEGLVSSVPTSPAPHIASRSVLQDDHPTEIAQPSTVSRTSEAERRQVTVMFCDLVDSTKLSQQLDPEDYRAVVQAYQEAAAAEIQPFDGYMAQYLGDGLMVYFGWPQAHEDAAHRAVYAGLAIGNAMGPLNDTRLEPQYGVRVAVHIGLHTGMAVIGEMGGGDRHEHLAMGDTPNIASRIQGLAAPDTVAISATTARLLQGAFALADLGLHTLKGVAEPMQVFRVLGPLEGHGDEAATAAGVPFLVGRDEEIGLLLRRWEQSKEGLGQVVLVSGEAGIGKSTLVEVMRAHVVQEGLPRIAFRCSPYHRNSALYPVIIHVEHLLRFDRDDTPETKLDKMEQGLQAYSFPLEEVVPLFAALFSMPLLERYPTPRLTPQQQKQQTLDALVAWLLEEAERQPMLVVWEDLHWADPSTLEMLGLVLDQAPTVPMLHVLTFRPTFTPSWPSRSHLTPVTLNHLERPQVEALITHLAGDKALPLEVMEYIVTKTDGMPLFVEELTKMLLESELLREDAEYYVLTGPLATAAIPATLQDSLMARLDRLPTGRDIAQLGAVLGREFPYELLQALAMVEESTLQDGLAQLVAAELLYQRGRPPRARYIFKHALIQDAAYQSVLRSTRRQVHERIAQMLAEQFPETATTQPELVAHHYAEAGRTEQAIAYWQHAGERAIERSANVEATAHLTQGLRLLTSLPETPERLQRELDLQVALGAVLMATQGYAAPEVGRVYTRARQLCQQVKDSPHLFLVLAGLRRFYLVRGKLQSAQELAEQLLALAQELHNREYLLEAHFALAINHYHLGAFALSRDYAEQGIALYDAEQHRALAFNYGIDPGVHCLIYAAWALWQLGYADQALARAHEALTLAHELSHPFSLARALSVAGTIYQFRREWRLVLEHAEACIALSTEHGFALLLAGGTTQRGSALTMQGHIEEGMAQMQQGITGARASGAKLGIPGLLSALAEGYVGAGQVEAGLQMLDQGQALVNMTGARSWEAELHRLKGELLQNAECGVRSAELTPEACFQQALSIARSQQAKFWELRAAMSLSRLRQRQDKRQEARKLLAPIYAWFTEGFDTADLREAKALLDELGR